MAVVQAIRHPRFTGGTSIDVVASDGDVYPLSIPAAGSGPVVMDADEAAMGAEAGALWVPEPGSLEELVLSANPLYFDPGDPRLGSYDYSGYGASVSPLNGAYLANGHVADIHPGAYVLGGSGSSDYIQTTAGTRRSLIRNPNFQTNLGQWTNFGPGTLNDFSRYSWAAAATAGIGDYGAYLQYTATAPAQTCGMYMLDVGTVVPGRTYTLSEYMGVAAVTGGATARMHIAWQTSGGVDISSPGTTINNGWNSLTAVAPPTAAKAIIYVFYDLPSTGNTYGAYHSGFMFEAASSRGSYFPTPAHLSAGRAGWMGTAYATASDIGLFANGTTRTHFLVERRNSVAAYESLMYGLDAAGLIQGSWGFANAEGNIYVSMDNTEYDFMIVDNANTGQTAAIALELNESTNAGRVLVNGVEEATFTHTAQYPADLILRVAGGNTFGGVLGPTAVFPRALTAYEHAELYARARYRFW